MNELEKKFTVEDVPMTAYISLAAITATQHPNFDEVLNRLIHLASNLKTSTPEDVSIKIVNQFIDQIENLKKDPSFLKPLPELTDEEIVVLAKLMRAAFFKEPHPDDYAVREKVLQNPKEFHSTIVLMAEVCELPKLPKELFNRDQQRADPTYQFNLRVLKKVLNKGLVDTPLALYNMERHVKYQPFRRIQPNEKDLKLIKRDIVNSFVAKEVLEKLQEKHGDAPFLGKVLKSVLPSKRDAQDALRKMTGRVRLPQAAYLCKISGMEYTPLKESHFRDLVQNGNKAKIKQLEDFILEACEEITKTFSSVFQKGFKKLRDQRNIDLIVSFIKAVRKEEKFHFEGGAKSPSNHTQGNKDQFTR